MPRCKGNIAEREVPQAESCAECPAVKRGVRGDESRPGSYHCEVFDVEWWNCKPESWARVCVREGWAK